MYILRRACRFWPGILLITIVMLILGEPERHWTSLWLFYQNYTDMERWTVGFDALWSISLDMQMHILLPIILKVMISFQRNSQRTYSPLYILIILSIVYSLIVFEPKNMNIPKLIYYHNPMALLMPQQIFDWIRTEYNVTVAFEKAIKPSPMKLFMEWMYLPISSRYSSFLIGSILAFNLTSVKNKSIIQYGTIKKYIYLILIVLFMILLMASPEPDTVNHVVLTIMFSITRQFFSLSQAFILFSAICPPTHPYYSSWINSFLSLRIWTPIAKLSYLIYILHFRIAFELIMTHSHLFDPKRFSIDSLILPCLALVLTICLILSTIWFILVDKPFGRLINMKLSNNQNFHTKLSRIE
jgi:peptidoglycan/LPS O-acetylase OafA/YrhL